MQVRVWSEAEWMESKEPYTDLLSRSAADPLYLSWDWQTLWWQHLAARAANQRLRVHAVYEDSTLIGTLAVACSDVVRGGLQYRSAQVLGNQMRDTDNVLSEYLDVVAVAGREQEVRTACLQSVLQRERCSEFVIGWCASGDAWLEAMAHHSRPWHYRRSIDPVVSYQADLSGGFERYLSGLSGNARRSLFNQRRKLSEKGAVRVSVVPGVEMIPAMREMIRLHALRWGAPALSGDTLGVHQALMDRWAADGRVQISTLKLGERTVSVLYDLRVGHTQYNIQMGFDPGIDSSISIGLLHLGYAMEQAAREGVQTYDLLAGAGRNTDYKQRFASRSVDVVTIQWLAGPLVAGMFRAYDGVKTWRERSRGGESALPS